jgi:hypothetical protein
MIDRSLVERVSASHAAREIDQLESFGCELAGAVGSYDVLTSHLREAIAAADQQSHTVANLIARTIAGIQFQDILGQQMKQVGQDLADVGECQTSLAACAAALPEISETGAALAPVQRLLDRFARKADAPAKAPREPAVELF